ncbi:MAG TPA: hypothetical protein EYG65_00750 [Rhodospirillales bacterium]|nr:hypothetical protein [Rhodospirillales bacterium]
MGCSEFNFQSSDCSNVDIGFDWFDISLNYSDENGDIDLTGFTLEMTIKDALGGATLLVLPTVGDALTTGLFIPTPTNGEVKAQITSVSSAAVAAGVHPYQTTITNPSGQTEIWMQGTIEFSNRGF